MKLQNNGPPKGSNTRFFPIRCSNNQMDEIFQYSSFSVRGLCQNRERKPVAKCSRMYYMHIEHYLLTSALRCLRSTGSKYLLMSYFSFFSNQYVWQPTSFAMLAKPRWYLTNKSATVLTNELCICCICICLHTLRVLYCAIYTYLSTYKRISPISN